MFSLPSYTRACRLVGVNSYNGFSPGQRTAALRWLNAEYAAGRRARPTSCDVCGQTRGLIEAHSEDYSGPPFGANIGAFGLCYRCHLMIHCRFSAPAAFLAYIESLEAGHVWPPTGRSWPTIQAMLTMSPGQLTMTPHDERTGGDPQLLRRILAGDFKPGR
jgi:hypothetical protein